MHTTSWFADGSMHVELRDTEYTSTWYRLLPGSTGLQRLGPPPLSDATYRFARNGLPVPI